MDFIEKIKREIFMRPIIRKGYSRKMASAWYKHVKYDNKYFSDQYTAEELKQIESYFNMLKIKYLSILSTILSQSGLMI